ncbi:MAG TPA: hypothetical protein ENI23_14210 [bacterium]|nr:hypothetical protein [bacterium]
MGNRLINKEIKHSLTRVKDGFWAGHIQKSGMPNILKVFGCMRCSWIGTLMCPHKKLDGEHHANWICSERVLYLKEEMSKIGSVPRLIQNEEAIKLKMIGDRMLWEYGETGDLHEDYKHIQKNLTTLVAKMRKQDEGIKFSEDITVTHQDFRKMVDIEAEKIEKRDKQTRPAEFTEKV